MSKLGAVDPLHADNLDLDSLDYLEQAPRTDEEVNEPLTDEDYDQLAEQLRHEQIQSHCSGVEELRDRYRALFRLVQGELESTSLHPFLRQLVVEELHVEKDDLGFSPALGRVLLYPRFLVVSFRCVESRFARVNNVRVRLPFSAGASMHRVLHHVDVNAVDDVWTLRDVGQRVKAMTQFSMGGETAVFDEVGRPWVTLAELERVLQSMQLTPATDLSLLVFSALSLFTCPTDTQTRVTHELTAYARKLERYAERVADVIKLPIEVCRLVQRYALDEVIGGKGRSKKKKRGKGRKKKRQITFVY